MLRTAKAGLELMFPGIYWIPLECINSYPVNVEKRVSS